MSGWITLTACFSISSRIILSPSLIFFEISERVISIRSPKSGYINGINAHALGELARQIGAGRYTKEDSIDHSVGIVLTRKKGDFVEVNDELARFYLSDKDVRLNDILNCFCIEDECKADEPLVYEVIE